MSLMESWNRWRGEKALKEARSEADAARKEVLKLRRHIKQTTERHEEQVERLEMRADRLKETIEGLIEANALFASTHSIKNDLADHKPVSYAQAMQRTSPHYDNGE